MKNQGVVKVFTVILAIVCLYHLSFTFVSNGVESDAEEFAIEQAANYTGDEDGKDSVIKEIKKKYLDSISGKTVYDLLITDYSYLKVKERELNLGLDLQGGMNVTLEVSLPDVIKALSNYSEDKNFQKAIELANEKTTTASEDYTTLFLEALNEVAPSVPYSTYFAHKDNKDLNFNSTNDEVESFLRKNTDDAIENSYLVLRSRIDRFGVSQPVIQRLGNTGRIMVELPGISNPERARKLITASAKLEFWKTYMAGEAYPFIVSMNDALKKRMQVEADTQSDSTESDTAKEADVEAVDLNPLDVDVEPIDTLTDNADANAADTGLADLLNPTSGDSAVSDSANAGQMSPEEIKKEFPLTRLIMFNLTQDQQQFVESAAIGYVSVFDTAELNKHLNDPELRAYIPGDVRFAYQFKTDENNPTIITLYTLKADRTGGEAVLTGDVITDARPQIGQQGWEVQMTMNAEGRGSWANITSEAAQKTPKGCVAIVLDGVVYSAPQVQGAIEGGISTISGSFKQEETKFLATILNAGKLPAPARIVEEAVVGPSLGAEAISHGLLSIIAGFLSVIAIMALIYSTAGWVANIAVLLNLYFILGVLSSLGAALTLPGIAGIILTLGMAVDANVLIYERVKEELALGKSLRNAVTNGYKNALSAIIDSNITTLLTGIVLLIFGSGPIYGFSVTLIIGILSSLFTAILITRVIFEGAMKKDRNVKFFNGFSKNLLNNVNIDFIGKRMMFYTVSGLLIVGGLASIFTKGLDFGVDFKGGWSYVIAFEEPVNISEVRENLTEPLGGAPEIKVFGTDNTLKITTDFMIASQLPTAADSVTHTMEAGLAGLGKFNIESTSKVGPTIADDIKESAVESILVALVLMFLYILFRFRKWQFATGTVIKLTHDVLVVLGLFSILDGIVPFTLEIDQSFIAAILTVIGYSINDSVVVMDRVREFLNDNTKNKQGIRELINGALNSTLSRTMITSLTTVGVLLILFIFGGEIIRGFSFAMLVGVIVGSYSSICIGAPLAGDLWKENKN